MSPTLTTSYPWTTTPFIANGPMGGFAGPALASEVSKAQGLGFIAGGYDLSALSAQLSDAKAQLSHSRTSGSDGDGGTHLPVGVGFLCFAAPLPDAVRIVQQHQPAAVWLFAAAQLADYAEWAEQLRAVSSARIWVQTGSVGAALEIARTARPDVLVLQGLDAGGHGLERGAGIVSLLPEAADALREAGFGSIPLVAAGGIVDGRGVAAALALGAAGVVMGTRFLASAEVAHPGYQAAILQAADGGQITARSKIFDEVKPEGNTWPVLYDGRGLVNATLEEHLAGQDTDEIRQLYEQALKEKDGGFGAEKKRVTVWAGTGVGLVKHVTPAGKIVEEVRESARTILKNLQAQL